MPGVTDKHWALIHAADFARLMSGRGFRRSHLSRAIAAWKTAKAQVTAHLGQTQFVICCQLLGDITEQGFEANDALFEFFVQKYGGMIQADGEGFYGAEGLLVDLS